MTASAIEWCDKVWNPVTGCRKVSAGCEHCYAESVAGRFWAVQYPRIKELHPLGVRHRARRFTDVQVHSERLVQPLGWRKPRRVFVNSMSDLFHEDVPDAFLDQVFAVMALSREHTFQVLTKRPARMRAYLTARSRSAQPWKDAARTLGYSLEFEGISLVPFPLPNVHLGVSVEGQRAADERIPLLLDTPAAVRWISAEPLLGPVSLCRWDEDEGEAEGPAVVYRGGMSPGGSHGPPEPVGCWDMGLDWVVIGGESGPGARPCDVEWIRALAAECRALEVPVFVKQLGARRIEEGCSDPGHTASLDRVTARKGDDPNEWPEDLRVREFPA